MEKITLPNGLRILLEPLDHLRTVSFGIWVASGSRYESPENNGISHLIEHMLFHILENIIRCIRKLGMFRRLMR